MELILKKLFPYLVKLSFRVTDKLFPDAYLYLTDCNNSRLLQSAMTNHAVLPGRLILLFSARKESGFDISFQIHFLIVICFGDVRIEKIER